MWLLQMWEMQWSTKMRKKFQISVTNVDRKDKVALETSMLKQTYCIKISNENAAWDDWSVIQHTNNKGVPRRPSWSAIIQCWLVALLCRRERVAEKVIAELFIVAMSVIDAWKQNHVFCYQKPVSSINRMYGKVRKEAKGTWYKGECL